MCPKRLVHVLSGQASYYSHYGQDIQLAITESQTGQRILSIDVCHLKPQTAFTSSQEGNAGLMAVDAPSSGVFATALVLQPLPS